MAAKTLSVVVVEDDGGWRSFICSALERHRRLCIVGEAADGLEALQKILELRPDLVALDIGLPKLNGLEVARRIRTLSPQSKVLIVSAELHAEIAEEAFRCGALGYVVKSEAASELLPAVESVLHGKLFISADLVGRVSVDAENGRVHEVAFYPDDAAYVAGLTRYIEAVLRRGDPVIAIATEKHRASLRHSLKRDHADIDALIENRNVLLLDSHESISMIMTDDMPDPARCEQIMGELVASAPRNVLGKHTRVAFCGQCAPLVLSQGNIEGAIQVEHLWDEITQAHGADTLCSYIWSSVPEKNRQSIVQRICAEHSRVGGLEAIC